MKSQQPAHAALNLSYVLHERSDSQTVKEYVRRAEAERRRCTQAIREIEKLSAAELGGRLVVLEHLDSSDTSEAGRRVISVNLGAIDLLPRLLHVAGCWPAEAEATIDLLDPDPATVDQPQTFFGAPAALTWPSDPPSPAVRWLFASAVLRPGYSSILLRLSSLDVDAATGGPAWRHAVRLAEDAIREFPLQWWCGRALWPRPAEETLPEFQTTRNGARVCGR
jgi:hypothetical protein